MKRAFGAALALASFAMLALPPPVVAIPLLSAGSATVEIGDTFTIPISIADAVDLESFQFDLSFVPTILQANVVGATAGAFLPGDWFFTSPGVVDNTLGVILGVSAFGSAASGSGVLANIELTAIGTGISPLALSNAFLNFGDGGFTVTNGEVCVSSPGATTCEPGGVAPEPGTVALLAMGLAVLAGRRRWRSTR